MAWPLSQDYNEAIQDPQACFADAELKAGEATCNALGLPMPRTGNFADVYEFNCAATKNKWAVKCFTRQVGGLRERYSEISRALQTAHLPFAVDFQYLNQGILVRGDWFPILKMRWVEGLLLNEFVRDNLGKPALLVQLGLIWSRMAKRLREASIAHCDLQHGNVLLVAGSTNTSLAVKLIDYDGMFVPSLAKLKSGEVGHPNFQHPQRLREGGYHADIDRFPLLVVATALRVLSVTGRGLWERYDTGDNFLFQETDLKAPGQSPLFKELQGLTDPQARKLVEELRRACERNLAAVPALEELLPEGKPTSARVPATPPKAGQAIATVGQETASEFADLDSALPKRQRASQRKGLPGWAWLAGGAMAAVLCIGVLLAVVLQGEKSTEPTNNKSKVTVELQIVPPDAKVFIDGKPIPSNSKNGKVKVEVDKGDHVLKVSKEGFRPYTKRFTWNAPVREFLVPLEILRNTVAVDLKITPFDAEVFVDGKETSTTRTKSGELKIEAEEGEHELKATKIGFLPYTKGHTWKVGADPINVVLKPPPPVVQGFVTLFNGKDLTGWHVENGDAQQWAVEEDAIVARCAHHSTRNYLLSNKEYTDFAIHLEFMTDSGGGGGVVFRAVNGEKLVGGGPCDHPILKVTDPVKYGDYSSGTTHWVKNDKQHTRPTEDLKLPAGEWHKLEITVRGDTCTALLAGKKVVDIRLDPASGDSPLPALKRSKGKIGFQAISGTVRYRNVQIKELSPPNELPPVKLAEHLELDLGGGVKLKVVRIEPGKFLMGSPATEAGREPNEKGSELQHEVEITQPYYLGAYTVTQAQYRHVMGKNPSWFSAQGKGKDRIAGLNTDDFPVEMVSWHEAMEFCRLVSELPEVKGRGLVLDLPTEAEWEYACRAGSKTVFHYGNALSSKEANFAAKGSFLGRTAKVGSYAPNDWGLYDMHGNVWQWCKDWYGKDYYANSNKKDPQGLNKGSARVFRGGSWDSDARNCRPAFRWGVAPANLGYSGGFRVVVRLPSRTPDPSKTVTVDLGSGVAMKFVRVPKGTFWMGGGSGRPPQKQVTIDQDFELAAYTVTQEQWQAVMGNNPSYFSRQGAGKNNVQDVSDADLKRFPVENVSWLMVQDFLKKLNQHVQGRGWVYRLPTEAQWEYACRGAVSSKEECSFDFYFDQPTKKLAPSQANFSNKLGRTELVGQYRPNRLGLYDMHGNLWQWCEDLWAVGDSRRAFRGGSWNNVGALCAASYRYSQNPDFARYDVGFRVSRVPSPPSLTADGFVPLFNGKDLTGWKTHPSQPGKWRVEKGVLIGPSTVSNLFSERNDYKDFHLIAKARINDQGVSGVYFRGPFNPSQIMGYEVQINSSHKINLDRTGTLFAGGDGVVAKVRESPVPHDEWFTLEVLAQGNRIVIKVNGKTTADYTDEKRLFTQGHFVLPQYNPHTVVEFSMIKIKELPDPIRRVIEATPENEKAGIAKLKQVLLSNTWHYRDSLFPPGENFRFYADGTWHKWKWNYWVVGPQSIRVHYDRNNRNKDTGVLFTFNPELTRLALPFLGAKPEQFESFPIGGVGL